MSLRMVHNNLAHTATLVASSTAGLLAAANMLSNYKSEVWRSTATTATLTLDWATAQQVSMAALMFCNLTTTATVRVRGYALPGDDTPVFDTGNVLACQAATQWAIYATVWFAACSVRQVVINITDTANTSGCIQVGRLLVGAYWQPEYGAEYGASVGVRDSATTERNLAGDRLPTLGHKHRVLTFSMSAMQEADRAACYEMLAGIGVTAPVFVSVFAQSGTPHLEASHAVFGTVQQTAIAIPYFKRYSVPLSIEEI